MSKVEGINESKEGVEAVDETGDILEPFNPSEIDIDMKQMTIYLFAARLKNDEIDMFVDFQRNVDLWDEVKQSRLIESMIIRIPLPAFYFDGTDDDNWLVIDGLQRLSAIKNFIIDENLKLKDLEFLKEYEDDVFSDLPRKIQRRIEETNVVAFIVKPGTPKNVKFNIFKRINTGGLTLKPQEIRNVMHQGEPARFLNKLAKSKEFIRATDNSIKTKRMLDSEFVLRFAAFKLRSYNSYNGDLDTFLNDAMEKISELSEIEKNKLENDFKKAMEAAYKIFKKDAFRKRYNKEDRRNPINKALYEAWAVNFGKLSDGDLNKLIKRKKEVREKFIYLLCNDKEFESSISSGTAYKKAVLIRFQKIENLIKEVL